MTKKRSEWYELCPPYGDPDGECWRMLMSLRDMVCVNGAAASYKDTPVAPPPPPKPQTADEAVKEMIASKPKEPRKIPAGRTIEQEIRFTMQVLENSRKHAEKGDVSGVFANQVRRLEEDLRELRRMARHWDRDNETYVQFLLRRAEDPEITRERRRQILAKAKRLEASSKHNKKRKR